VLLVFGFPSKNHVLTRGNGQEDIFLAIFGGKPLLSKSNQFTQQQPIGTPWASHPLLSWYALTLSLTTEETGL
jgi:hypothetical protein